MEFIIYDELCESAGETRTQKASKYVQEKRVSITKILYDDGGNFEITGKVRGNGQSYKTYIKVQNEEIEDLRCECLDYESHYGACKHIVATMQEFISNPFYLKMFGNKKVEENIDIASLEEEDTISLQKTVSKEKYRVFKQLLNSFYEEENEQHQNIQIAQQESIKLIPKLFYSEFNNQLKIEFKIGNKQYYKIKDITEFYERFLKGETFHYGAKLEMKHTRESFEKDSLPLLEFLLKYAEVLTYANESVSSYSYYGRAISVSSINISNAGLDDLFSILKGKTVSINNMYGEETVLFSEQPLDFQFKIQKENDKEYKLIPNIDVFEYDILEGKDYLYVLCNNVIYQCEKSEKDTTFKLLDVFKKNYTKEIVFQKEDLTQLFSVIVPKIKKQIKIEELEKEDIEKYIPKELFVKIFLDYDIRNYITADIRFCYGTDEFNPIAQEETKEVRNIIEENNVLNMFKNSGFLLEKEQNQLILVDEERIYEFLTQGIEEYMQKFEVLATENFKNKEIKQPKLTSIGMRIENNLLNIDLSGLDFDRSELNDIMKKYKLKKKYHRLKNGTYLSLEENDTFDFIESVASGMDLDYKQLEKGEIQLPVYRSLYLDRLLQNMNTQIKKDATYNNIVNQIDKKQIEPIEKPKQLQADLRSYQQVGYQWLKTLDQYNLGGILADDMGLGKTLQLLSVIQSYKEQKENTKPSIVICPSSLTLNWKSEAKKFTPNMKTLVIHGSAEERKKQISCIPDYDLIITSYDSLKRDREEYKENNFEFKYIIADEAQYIKNNQTQNAKAIKAIVAETRFALTGTPIENSLSELWSIFDFIMPGYLFNYKKFKDLYEMPIVRDEDSNAMRKLKMLIEPFILRRIKKEVLTELPDKTVTVLDNQMQDEQLNIYLSYMAQAKQEAMEELNTNGFEKSQIKILALLMRLRQICCHPSLFLENYKGGSSKLTQCVEIITDAVEAGHKILLFSGYTSMFPFLETELKKSNIKYFKLTGQTKVGERIELVEEFNKNPDIKVFLISLKAGGTGLNLIGADMVIHYDPWWNVSAENQATDRTYRIGQKKNVQVYKLITKNSIEEKIFELQKRKEKLMDNMLSTKETFISKLSKDEIMQLFQ